MKAGIHRLPEEVSPAWPLDAEAGAAARLPGTPTWGMRWVRGRWRGGGSRGFPAGSTGLAWAVGQVFSFGARRRVVGACGLVRFGEWGGAGVPVAGILVGAGQRVGWLRRGMWAGAGGWSHPGCRDSGRWGSLGAWAVAVRWVFPGSRCGFGGCRRGRSARCFVWSGGGLAAGDVWRRRLGDWVRGGGDGAGAGQGSRLRELWLAGARWRCG